MAIPSLHVAADSISMHYGPYLEAMLSGQFEYSRKVARSFGIAHVTGANGGDSAQLLEYVLLVERSGARFEYFIANAGLHDIRRRDGLLQTPEEAYAANVSAILGCTRRLATNPIWANTTPVVDMHHNSIRQEYHRYDADVVRFNMIAGQLAADLGVPVLDLYHFTANLGGEEIRLDHVHFTDEARRAQASYVAGWLGCFSRSSRQAHPIST